jgi:hypothetical protein
MSEIFIDSFFPQTKEELQMAVKELIGRCPINMSQADIEFAIEETIKEEIYP